MDYECSNVPSPIRKKQITEFIAKNEKLHVSHAGDKIIIRKATEIMGANVKEFDAYHVASAIYAGCEYFISVDYRLLKYKSNEIKMVSPIVFITEMEGKE